MKKSNVKVAAAIDIGSSVVRMQIAQWNGKTLSTLEELERGIHMGQEVFTAGRISFETVRTLSGILEEFTELAKEYGPTRIQAVATTALREADNQALVLDRIRIRNRLDISVLDEVEVNSLIFDAMLRERAPKAGKTLIVYAGTGTIGLALREGEQISFTHSMETGLLKIMEMLRSVTEQTRRFDQVTREYLDRYLAPLLEMADFSVVDGLIFNNGYMEPLLSLFGAVEQGRGVTLKAEEIRAVWAEHRVLSLHQIASRYSMSSEDGGMLYATLALLDGLLEMTGASRVLCSRARLTDALVGIALLPRARRSYRESMTEGTIATTFAISSHYHSDRNHILHQLNIAFALFESLRRLHGLSPRQHILLQVACILHEIGEYTNTKNPQLTSADLVKNMQIYGLSSHETRLVAHMLLPGGFPDELPLSGEDELFVAKMHALLQLADALDASHLQKAAVERIELVENRLEIHLRSNADFTLEWWMFQQAAPLLRETFGIDPELYVELTHKIN